MTWIDTLETLFMFRSLRVLSVHSMAVSQMLRSIQSLDRHDRFVGWWVRVGWFATRCRKWFCLELPIWMHLGWLWSKVEIQNLGVFSWQHQSIGQSIPPRQILQLLRQVRIPVSLALIGAVGKTERSSKLQQLWPWCLEDAAWETVRDEI